MRRILKRFTGLFCVLALCLSMLPVSALAAEDAPSNQPTTLLSDDNVAKIEENEYPTLDEAVEAAEDGATIELLADATTKGWNLTKSLTITSAPDLAEKPTVTFEKDGIALWGKTLTFKGIDVVMNGVGSTPYGEWTWMTICASKDAVLALDNVNMTMDATGSTGSPHAIYFCSNNKLNLTNGSVLTIKTTRTTLWSGTAVMAGITSISLILPSSPTTTAPASRVHSMPRLPILRWMLSTALEMAPMALTLLSRIPKSILTTTVPTAFLPVN